MSEIKPAITQPESARNCLGVMWKTRDIIRKLDGREEEYRVIRYWVEQCRIADAAERTRPAPSGEYSMNDKIKPALTPDEWGNVGPNHVLLRRRDEGDPISGNPEQLPTYTPLARPHALAALALYGQLFGFTLTHLIWLREEADVLYRNGAGAGAMMCSEIADLVEALLPPEKPST